VAETWRALEDAPGSPAPAAAGGAGPTAADGAAARPTWPLLVAALVVVIGASGWLLISGMDSGAATVAAANGALPTFRPVSTSAGRSAAASAAPGSADPSALAAGAPLVVDVDGAVRRPGVYRLVRGSRIGDAVAAAGGYGPRVDTSAAQALNLAALLEDGQQVHVPARSEAAVPASDSGVGAGSGAAPAAAAPGGPVNLNTASAEQLDSLPGVGPATVAKIVAARPFGAVQDLLDRMVVGPATFEKLKALVTVR
jgi:competence protein ComEA